MKQEHKNALATGRKKQNGTASREVSRQKIERCCVWILRFGYSCPHILDQVAEGKAGSIVNRMVKQGLAVSFPVSSPQGLACAPNRLVMLTELGVAMAERAVDLVPISGRYNPDRRVNTANVRHSIYLQQNILNKTKQRILVGYLTERELKILNQSIPGKKLPDATLFMTDQRKLIVEAELTGKWRHDLSEFIVRLLRELESDPTHCILIISDHQALLDRYKEYFHFGKEFEIFERLPNRSHRTVGTYAVPPKYKNRIYLDFFDGRPQYRVVLNDLELFS